MEQGITMLQDIVPGTKNWTAKLQVIEKQKVLLSKAGNKYQKLVLLDEQGNHIEALICNTDIQYFKHHFQLYKRYLISNAKIQPDSSSTTSMRNRTWIIDNCTIVQPIDEAQPPLIPQIFRFTPFTKLHQHIDDNSDIDVLGLVIEVQQREQKGPIATRNIIIIDQSSMPIILTLWGDHEKDEGHAITEMIHTHPIIAALRVKVSSYHTLNLSTKYASCILVNPPIQEAPEIKSWADANQQQIRELLIQRAFEDRAKLLPIPQPDEITTITDLLHFPLQKAYWIRGKAQLSDTRQKFWYRACTNCNKSLRSDPFSQVICSSCHRKTTITLRSRMTIQLQDSSGSLTLDVFGEDAEKLFPAPASELQLQESQLPQNLIYQSDDHLQQQIVLILF